MNIKSKLKVTFEQIKSVLSSGKRQTPRDIGESITNIILFNDNDEVLVKESSELSDILDLSADLEITYTEPYTTRLFSKLKKKVDELEKSLSEEK